MSKAPDAPPGDRDTMRPEYDFSGAVRGVTARRYAQGANVVVAPDLLDVFPDAKAVDETLRANRLPKSVSEARQTPVV